MTDPAADAHEAASQLRAIRSLMERSTIYRALSAPAALGAGALAAVVAAIQLISPPSDGGFLAAWLGVLTVSSIINFSLLSSGARKRGEPFVSAGMKHALLSILPPLVCGLAVSLINPGSAVSHGCYTTQPPPGGAAVWMAAMWVLFYGLGLWAARAFSPVSMQRLAIAFLLTGLGLAVLIAVESPGTVQAAGSAGSAPSITAGPWIMLTTFGLFHILYGILLMLRRTPSSPAAA